MKIGVYTIALNEERHIKRWAETTQDADCRLIVDTGSTDRTVARAVKHWLDVETITVKPWRFDDARNAALSMLPADLDIVIALDMDELLVPTWREELLKVWTPETTRLRYLWQVHDGEACYAEKIAARFGNRWRFPAHETLVSTTAPTITTHDDILIEHHPDTEKRRDYLPLLRMALAEDPDCDRSSHMLAREYFFRRRWTEAIQQFQHHLGLSRARWRPERAASMRYVAKCYAALRQPQKAQEWVLRAVAEDFSRETLLDAARFSFDAECYHACIGYCEQALRIISADKHTLTEPYAQREGPYEIMALAYSCLGDEKQRAEAEQQARALRPTGHANR